nr:zinc finger, CCHC-type [Tanacetum cinerariifolium]
MPTIEEGKELNVPIFVGNFSVVMDFAVLENIDAYRDEGMGDVIFGEPFLREVGIKTRRFDGMITIYNGRYSVSVPALTRDHKGNKINTPYPGKVLIENKFLLPRQFNGSSYGHHKLRNQLWNMVAYKGEKDLVDLTKEFLSSRFSMKYMEEADVILGIRIKHESNGIAISQSRYIEKVLKKFNYFECIPISTHMDTILEGYTDASWISNTKDNSSTSGWVFLLGGGAISWASKKQICITGSTMKFEFVTSAAASKESKRLKNLLFEIPL